MNAALRKLLGYLKGSYTHRGLDMSYLYYFKCSPCQELKSIYQNNAQLAQLLSVRAFARCQIRLRVCNTQGTRKIFAFKISARKSIINNK